MAGSLTLSCPNCRAKLRISADAVGKAVRCSQCGYMFRTRLKPAGGSSVGTGSSAVAPAAGDSAVRNDGTRGHASSGLTAPLAAPAKPAVVPASPTSPVSGHDPEPEEIVESDSGSGKAATEPPSSAGIASTAAGTGAKPGATAGAKPAATTGVRPAASGTASGVLPKPAASAAARPAVTSGTARPPSPTETAGVKPATSGTASGVLPKPAAKSPTGSGKQPAASAAATTPRPAGPKSTARLPVAPAPARPPAASPPARSPASAKAGSGNRSPVVPVMPAAPVTPRVDPATGDQLVGKRLGPYQINKRVGSGAKGIVYDARDVRSGNAVAVKVLAPQLMESDPVAVQRFLLEAKAAGRIDHPNVVGVLDVGRHENIIYIAMPLVTGGSVLDRLDLKGAYDPIEATRIVRMAARGLGAAHALGIVHRDVKPANILLGPDGEVRVADFGMAKMMDGSFSGLTEPGTLMGTPHYMSPEQCLGGPIDFRADVYSLGATYFRMLTGRTPFSDMSPLAVANKQMYERHPDPRDVKSDVPGMCVRIIDKAMEKNPDHRWQSIADMADALQSVETALTQTRDMVRESEKHAGRRSGETVILNDQFLADLLNESSDEIATGELAGMVESNPFLARLGDRAAEPGSPQSPPPGASGKSPAVAAPSAGQQTQPPSSLRTPALRTAPAPQPHAPPQPPALNTVPPAAFGGPAPSYAGAANGRPDPRTSAVPVQVAFKLRFPGVDAAKQALGFLREDVRSVARKVIAPTILKGTKAGLLDISLTMVPADLFGVVKTLIAAGGEFLGLTTDDATTADWLRRQIGTIRR